jgi:16S rRNA processing protein RimM
MLRLNDEIEQYSFEAGRLVKLHGVSGRMILRLNDPVEELTDFPEWVFVSLDGELVPYHVAEESVIQKDTSHLILGFEGISNQQLAKELVGKTCHLPGSWTDWFGEGVKPEKNWTGFNVFDATSGQNGLITDIQEIPGNPLLEVTFGHKKVLVPVNPVFIKNVDEINRLVTLEIPPDLLSL